MKAQKLTIFFISLLFTITLFAKDCPNNNGKYGNGFQYQDMFCRMMIGADRVDSASYRNLTFTDEGLIQVFSNFPGTTNSNSTGVRVFYLFPLKTDKSIKEADATHLSFKHPSGADLIFDQNGHLSSPQLKMKIDRQVNSKNKSGIEIESFSNGIVVDLGYRQGNTPTLNKDAVVTITDKNGKTCKMINSDLNIISKDNVELRYKSNEAMYTFLSKRCPQLDFSDFLSKNENHESIKDINRSKNFGAAPVNSASNTNINDSKREAKPQIDELGALIDSFEMNKGSSIQK